VNIREALYRADGLYVESVPWVSGHLHDAYVRRTLYVPQPKRVFGAHDHALVVPFITYRAGATLIDARGDRLAVILPVALSNPQRSDRAAVVERYLARWRAQPIRLRGELALVEDRSEQFYTPHVIATEIEIDTPRPIGKRRHAPSVPR
jgi:hypothetical protein